MLFSHDRSEHRWGHTMATVWPRSWTSTGDLGHRQQELQTKKTVKDAKGDNTVEDTGDGWVRNQTISMVK